MSNRSTIKVILAGLTFVAIGTLMLLDNLSLLPTDLPDYVISWKSLLVLIGLYLVLFRREAGGLLLIVLGMYFILPEALGIPSEELHLFWPGVFIAIGLTILMKLMPGCKKKKERVVVSDQDSINYNVYFGGENKQFSSYNFKGGRMNVVCGGVDIDLTNCTLSKDHRIIDVSIICGGISLRVPKEWNIIMEVTPIMGGVEDSTKNYSDAYIDPANQLTIRGSLIMGGIEVQRR